MLHFGGGFVIVVVVMVMVMVMVMGSWPERGVEVPVIARLWDMNMCFSAGGVL